MDIKIYFGEIVNIYIPRIRYLFWYILNIASRVFVHSDLVIFNMLSVVNWVICTLESHDNYYDDKYHFCSKEQ